MRRVHYTRLGVELALNGAGVSGDHVKAEASLLSCRGSFGLILTRGCELT